MSSFSSSGQPLSINTMNLGSKKRPAPDGASGGPVASPVLKRRKQSIISAASVPNSAHPLRQTSFPPEDNGSGIFSSARSPSADVPDNVSFVSGSQSAVGAPVKKRRGRKSKAEKLREQTPSVVGSLAGAGGRAGTAGPGAGGSSVAGGGGRNGSVVQGQGDAGGADDDDGEGDMPDSGAAAAKRTDEERKEEKRLRAALVACMDFDQYERISAWRAAKLPDAVIRRLVNTTVSQSVPSSVVTAVRSVTKYFLTDLITNAQKIQGEWIAAEGEQQADTEWPGLVLSRNEPQVQELYDKQSRMAIPEWEPETAEPILKEPPRGPLRPDHLREAWRRYRLSAQSRSAGTMDLWHAQQHTGVERFPPRTGGRRIFK